MSYKNIEELEAAQQKWNSSRLQDRDPTGYERHLAAVKAFNSSNSSNSSSESTNKKKSNKGTKYKPPSKEAERTNKILQDTRDAAKRVKSYKPERLNVQRNFYSNDLPKRPSVPKLPKLKIPGGMYTSRTAKPSGLPGTIKQYKPKGDYSKAYGSVDSKFKGTSAPKPYTPKPIPAPTLTPTPKAFKGSTNYAPGVTAPGIKVKPKTLKSFSKQNTTSKAPSVTGGVRPIPKKPFGKGTSNYAPGASIGPAPKKKK